MTEDEKTPPIQTVKLSEATVRRGEQAYRNRLRKPVAVNPIIKALRGQDPSPTLKLLASQVSDNIQPFRVAADSGWARNASLLTKSTELSIANVLAKQIAGAAGVERMMKEMSAQFVPDIAKTVGDQHTSLQGLFSRDFLDQIARLPAAALGTWDRSTRTLLPAPRPVAPATRTLVRERAEVRQFLVRLHPALLRKLDGIYEALDLSDGTGQSAYSATELLKLVVFTLVTFADVKAYARQTYDSKPLKHHALELIAVKYAVDASILLTLTRSGCLAEDFQNIKHFEHEMDSMQARGRLLELIDELEDLLVFMVQAITR